jgi:hypothetical protein
MRMLLDHPMDLLFVSVLMFSLASWVGAVLSRGHREEKSDAFQLVQGATLTLLGLLLGFTFAMAVSRFDLRMELAVNEANAIETAWLRAGMMPAPYNDQSRALLLQYTNARLDLGQAGTREQAREMAEQHAQELQRQIWRIAEQSASDKRDAVTAVYLNALQEVFDLRTRRAEIYDNRIPGSAWVLLLFIGIMSNLLVGYGIGNRWWLLWVLPVVVAGTLMLVSDLDSPVSGFIQVQPKAPQELRNVLKP